MPPAKKALCVGVNYTGTEAELRGPVHDALQWVEVLTRRCGFSRQNVIALIDEYPSGEPVLEEDERHGRPTKDNILEALEWLVQDVAEGDVVFFTFAGHGVQIPDASLSGDDGEQLDEALCPMDWEEFDGPGGLLTPFRLVMDETLHRYFARLPAGALLTVVLDACFTSTAGLVRTPLKIDFQYPDRELGNDSLTQHEYGRLRFNCDVWLQQQHVNALPRRLPCEPQRPFWCRLLRLFAREAAPPLDEGLAVFCIAACGGSQTALDASLDGRPQGVLSYCLQRAMEQLRYRCTYLELCETTDRIARGLLATMPQTDQHFQLSYGKNAGPDECLLLDSASAFVAKDRARRRRGQKVRT